MVLWPRLFRRYLQNRNSLIVNFKTAFISGLLLNCNWSVVSDITLYIVIPTRRSIASATIILISHALGDAISPYLIGAIADSIRTNITPIYPIVPISVRTSFFLFEKIDQINPRYKPNFALYFALLFDNFFQNSTKLTCVRCKQTLLIRDKNCHFLTRVSSTRVP